MTTGGWRRKPSKRAVVKDDLVTLGARLWRLRKFGQANRPKGLTQREVAEMLDVSPAYVSQIERGSTVVSLRILRRMASIYGVLPMELMSLLRLQEFDWLVTLQSMGQPVQEDPLSHLDEDERRELITYLTFLRMKRVVQS